MLSKSRLFSLMLLTFPYQALADGCAAINEAQVQLGGFHFGYSSWVDTPVPREQLIKYNRCVRVLDGTWFDFDWPEAGLKGRAEPDKPVFVQYVFFRQLTELAHSQLRFGRHKPLENSISVGFLRNEAEGGKHAMVDTYIDHLVDLNRSSIDALLVQPDVVQGIESKISLSFPLGEDATGHLEFSLSSDVMGFFSDAQQAYQIKYSLDLPEGMNDNTSVVLQPRSEVLKELFLKSFDSSGLIVSGDKQSLFLVSPYLLSDGLFLPLTAYSDVIDVTVNSEAVASFPVTFYASRQN